MGSFNKSEITSLTGKQDFFHSFQRILRISATESNQIKTEILTVMVVCRSCKSSLNDQQMEEKFTKVFHALYKQTLKKTNQSKTSILVYVSLSRPHSSLP